MKWINNIRLRNKLLAVYLLLALVPMAVLFLYFELSFVYKLEQRTLDMESVIMEQMASEVESYISQASGLGDTIASSQILQKALSCSADELEELMGEQKERDELLTWLSNTGSQKDGETIRKIHVYCDPDSPLLHWKVLRNFGIFASREKIDTSLWYGMLQGQKGNRLMASAVYLNSWENNQADSIAYIHKISYYVEGEKQEAYAAVYFNRDYLEQILDDYGRLDGSCVYLIDEKECLVGLNGRGEYGLYILDEEEIPRLVGEEKSFRKIDYGSHKAWTIYHEIGWFDWKLVFTVSQEGLTAEARRDRNIFMGVYLGMAVLLCIPFLMLSGSITGRITRLRNQMTRVKDEPPQKLEMPACRDEIGELTESYNYMAEKLNTLIREKIEVVEENNRMEMNLLRSQLNPHFLYNTLDMISWYAVKGSTEDVVDSIQSLARFYRFSLNNGEILTTLERELWLIQEYIGLQSRRISSDIQLLVDIPETMLEEKIPQFLLQPLVENSLKHGILEKEEPEGVITVTGWEEEDRLVLILADDGVGMSPQKAKALKFKDCTEEAEHIGVGNIRRRLELFYGKDGFSMEYTSTPGEGTQVELQLKRQPEKISGERKGDRLE